MNNYPQFEQELKALLSKYNVRLEADMVYGVSGEEAFVTIYTAAGQTLGKKTWKHVKSFVSIGGEG